MASMAEGSKTVHNVPIYSRETRSGRCFARWDGPNITAASPNFDFESLLRASTDRENASTEGHNSFSLSPLSTPEATPVHSRAPSIDVSPTESPAHRPIPLLPKASTSLPTSPETPTARPLSRKERMKQQSRDNRRKRRRAEKDDTFALPKVRRSVVEKFVTGATGISSKANLQDSEKVTSTAYTGLDDRIRHRTIYRLDEVVGPSARFDLKLIEWDGKTPMPILDANGTLIGVLAGFPGSAEEWMALHAEGCIALEKARLEYDATVDSEASRRGEFHTLLCGVSHGGGQQMPTNLRNSDVNRRIAEELNSMAFFKRSAAFATSVVATWAPELYDYYVDHLGNLHARYPSLQRNFTSSIFAATTYNLGPQTLCFRHTDFGNLPFGWCAVTAMGSFDPKKGGHLILWECGLVIEFPPGSTILLPSAVISHSNVAIDQAEMRYSFTQYTAGGLFRWVDNDYKTLLDYRASLSPSQLNDLDERNGNRWKFGLSLLPQLKSTPAASL